jgi:hypothetical protein
MQTFLPDPDFRKTANLLDYRRLGKQRVETKQILLTLDALEAGVTKKGWANHPAVLMWRGYSDALALYGLEMCLTWRDRGYKDTLAGFFDSRLPAGFPIAPSWLGDPKFHSIHRAKLLGKDPKWYGQFGWTEKPLGPDMPYLWPIPDKMRPQSLTSFVG